jgi:hypothetical protein
MTFSGPIAFIQPDGTPVALVDGARLRVPRKPTFSLAKSLYGSLLRVRFVAIIACLAYTSSSFGTQPAVNHLS